MQLEEHYIHLQRQFQILREIKPGNLLIYTRKEQLVNI